MIQRTLTALLLAASALTAQAPPTPMEQTPPETSPTRLLERVRSAHEAVAARIPPEARAWAGPVEIVSDTRWSGRLEWVRGPEGFRLALYAAGDSTGGSSEDMVPPRAVLWRRGDEGVRLYRAGGAVRDLESAAAGLDAFLAVGGSEALAPVALELGVDPFGEPEGLALEISPANRPVLLLSRAGGAVESRFEIDPVTDRIREVEVRRQAVDPLTGVPRGPVTTVRVELTPQPVAGGTLSVAFTPPAEPVSAEPLPGASISPVFGETVEVRLLSVPVRVLTRSWEPVADLTTEDFEVTVRPRRGRAVTVPVTAVDYFEYGTARERLSLRDDPVVAPEPFFEPPPPPRRLVVFFLQADKEGARVAGHLRMVPRVRALVDALPPEDRVAVVSFDSHLKLWVDVTRDREAVKEVLGTAYRFGAPEPVRRTSRLGPLGRAWDGPAARRAATVEQALDVTAQALETVSGTKEMIFVGWGLGRFGAGGVRMQEGYDSALAKMGSGTVTVHVLDVSEADYHDLEFGLRQVARDTGGLYFPTFRDPEVGVRALSRALSGYYVLRFNPETLPAEGRLEIRLAPGRDGFLHASGIRLETLGARESGP